MDIFSRMVHTQTLLFLFVALGFVVSRAGIITRENRHGFNLFLLNVTLPAMIFTSFLGGAGFARLSQAGLIMLVSAGSCLMAWVVGRVVWRKQPPTSKSTLVFGTMFTNAGNAGLPVVQYVFGDEGLFYASIFLIPVRILMWTLGVSQFTSGKRDKRWKALLLNPGIVAVIAGLCIAAAGIHLPDVLSTAIRRVGDMTGPLAMVLIGTTLAETSIREVFSKEAWLVSFLRLVVVPLLTLAALSLIPGNPLVGRVAFVQCAMPIATNTVVLAERYGADYRLASNAVFLSTALSLFTVPLLTLLL